MNTQSNISLVRLNRPKQSRYNPLLSIGDPAQLTRRLDAFEVGYFKDAVNIWDLLEQRDDLVRSVVLTSNQELMVAEARKSLDAGAVPREGAYPKAICNRARSRTCVKILRRIGREQLVVRGCKRMKAVGRRQGRTKVTRTALTRARRTPRLVRQRPRIAKRLKYLRATESWRAWEANLNLLTNVAAAL